MSARTRLQLRFLGATGTVAGSWSPHPPRRVSLTHGEPQAADALCQAIEARFGWEASVPEYLDTVQEPSCPR